MGRVSGRHGSGGGAARVLGVGAGLALLAAGAAGAQDVWPARHIVDTPTAGLVPRGAYDTQARVFPAGGLEARLDVGVLRWLSLGAAYGGLRIIGDGEPEWNPYPGFFARVRPIEESYTWPAVAFGIDTQGSGWWDEERQRYQFKSRGLYVVLSKNYALWGDLGLHAGVSRSLEDDGDTNATPFVGIEKSLGRSFGVALEYDPALNDDRDDGVYGQGRGYLNALVRWNLAPRMQIRFAVRDMLDNSEPAASDNSEVVTDEGWGRELWFSYAESF